MIILTINVLTAQKIPISVRYHIAANIILIRIMAIAQEEDFRVQMVYVYVPLLFLFGMEPNVFNASCLSILILIIKHVWHVLEDIFMISIPVFPLTVHKPRFLMLKIDNVYVLGIAQSHCHKIKGANLAKARKYIIMIPRNARHALKIRYLARIKQLVCASTPKKCILKYLNLVSVAIILLYWISKGCVWPVTDTSRVKPEHA